MVRCPNAFLPIKCDSHSKISVVVIEIYYNFDADHNALPAKFSTLMKNKVDYTVR